MPEAGRHEGRRLGFFQLVLPSLEGDTIVLGAADAKHLRLSVRARPGDTVPATDGAGGRGEVEVVRLDAGGGEVRPRLLGREEPPRRRLWLATRAAEARFDWLVEKAVELGAWGLVPLRDRSGRREGARDRLPRWHRLARAAMEQCGTAWHPVLEAPRDPHELISGEGLPRFDRVLLADPAGRAPSRLSPGLAGPGDHLLLVGPPEGFGAADQATLRELPGLELVSLGPRRLRSETAAMALLVLASALSAPETPFGRP